MNRNYGCPHCINLNRTRSEKYKLNIYHNLRLTKDPTSKITCPVLLDTKCLQCGLIGHTKSYCKIPDGSSNSKSVQYSSDNRFNSFSILSQDDSESESESESESFGPPYRPRSPDYPPPPLP